VAQEIFGALGCPALRNVRGRADDDVPERLGEPHLHHVALARLGEPHAGVVSLAHDVDETVLDGNLDVDPRLRARNAGSTGSMTNGSADRGTESRRRPTTSPGWAATSLSAASACPSPGPAASSRRLPESVSATLRVVRAWDRKINPGKVFDLTLPIEQVAEGYRAMHERRAIKALLRS
jgi:hypothetical protein